MHETHGTSNTLAVKPYSRSRRRRSHREFMEKKKINKELCKIPFSGKYRKMSSDIDILVDKEPIMFVQFIQK